MLISPFLQCSRVTFPDSAWKLGHSFFEKAGTENILLVSPFGNSFYTDDPNVIHQITKRRENFPKPIADYKILNIFGTNVITTEGNLWRMHRKVTSASFNEANTALVWKETIQQTQSLLGLWTDHDKERTSSETLRYIDRDTMRLALHIIGYVGFGLKLVWPGEKASDDDSDIAHFSKLEPSPGHTMSFVDSMEGTCEKLFVKLLVPGFLLKNLPFQTTKVAHKATENFEKYLDELLRYKQKMIKTGHRAEIGMDVMGQLVETQYGNTGKKGDIKLTDEEIKGNAFIMLLAGHETTANSLHFSLLELARVPAAQRALQRDVDAILGRDSDPRDWDYETNIGPLLGSAVGATMNELMRLIPSVVQVVKSVTPDRDQPITIQGQKCVLPKGTYISLVTAAVQRNPNYWPKGDKNSDKHDINEFNPARWIQKTEGENDNIAEDEEDWGGYQGSDSSPELFRPVQGSYIPFSNGARSCLGRRIAVVEIVVALAVIFQKYSVELAVDEWATDEEIALMSRKEKAVVYAKAQRKCDNKISSAYSLITLKLHGEHIPIRLVKRGYERFICDN